MKKFGSFLAGFSWNEIGDRNNLGATFDFIHLYERSGILLKNLVKGSLD